MKRRIKPTSEIQNFEQADELLKGIGICQIRLEKIETEQKAEIVKIKERTSNFAKPIQKEKKAFEKLLADFLRSREQDFKVERSKKRLWGRYGFQKSPGKLVTLAETTWEMVKTTILKKANDAEKEICLKTKIDVDKSNILQKARNGEIQNSRLQKLGMVVITPDEPFWEPDRQALQPYLD